MTKNIFLFILLSLPFAALNISAQTTSAQRPDVPVPSASIAALQAASAAAKTNQTPVGATQTDATPAQKINKDLPVVVLAKPKTALFGRQFEVQVELPQEAKLDLKAFDRKDFEIIKQTRNQINPRKITLTVIAFNLGVLQFPQTTWTDIYGNKYYSDTFRIETKPTKTKVKAQGIADIRPPFRPFNPWYIVLALAAASAAFALWRWYKLRKAVAPAGHITPYTADNRPLHIIALEQIDNLLMEGLWENQHYKLFYTRLTDIMRDYFAARFLIEAHRFTSRDLIKSLKNCKEFKFDIDPVAQFLKEADYVKFAKVIPDQTERDAQIENLRNIIYETRQPLALQPSGDDVLKTDIKVFDASSGEQNAKAGPEIEIIRSEKEFTQRLIEREQGITDLSPAPHTVAPSKKDKPKEQAAAPHSKENKQSEKEMKELFLVSRQPFRPIDLKVKSALEKQGIKYAQMLEVCFTQPLVFKPQTEAHTQKAEEPEAVTHRTLP